MGRLARTLATAALALAGLAVAAVLAEGILRALDRPPQVRSGWLSTHLAVEENEMQYRGQPIRYEDGDHVVLLVGDSQVEAKACSYDWMPERRLEHYLRELSGLPVRVFSVGASGYGQDQELLALRRYLRRFRADRVVAWLTLNNDVKDNTWPTFSTIDGRPKPTFWLEQGRLAGPDHMTAELVGSPIRLVALIDLARRRSPDAEWAARHLPPPYEPLSESAVARSGETVRDDWQTLADQGLMSAYSLAIEKNDRALRLAPASERTRYGIALTRELLRAMREVSESAGARFTLFAVDKGDKGEEMDGIYRLGGSYYRASSEQFWENVGEITDGFDYHLLPIIEPLWQAGKLDHHLNEHATDDVMRELAARLAPGLAPGLQSEPPAGGPQRP